MARTGGNCSNGLVPIPTYLYLPSSRGGSRNFSRGRLRAVSSSKGGGGVRILEKAKSAGIYIMTSKQTFGG